MNRIKNAINEYEKRSWKPNEANFRCEDIPHVIDATPNGTPAEIALMALEAGFMIGYRKGQRDAKKGV